MKKLLFILLLLSGCVQLKEPFCGTSTYSECTENKECVITGCSSQICQSTQDEQAFTTCEYKECYNPELYNLECNCVVNKCQWT